MPKTTTTKKDVLDLLLEKSSPGKALSGSEIASILGISRNSVWKAIHALQEEGYDITSEQSRGYMLSDEADILSKKAIQNEISSIWESMDAGLFGESVNLPIPISTTVLDTVSSTNSYAKTDLQDLPCVVASNEQTQGRGRLGRDFVSPKNSGIYMSFVFRPLFPLQEITSVTTITAAILHKVLSNATSSSLGIKWVNDIYSGDKKVAGILTEGVGSLEFAGFDKLIIGIGINCYSCAMSSIPTDLSDKIGYLYSNSINPPVSRSRLIAEISTSLAAAFCGVTALNKSAYLSYYKKNCIVIGKDVTVSLPGQAAFKAHIDDIDDDFGLVARVLSGEAIGQTTILSGGEISLSGQTF